MVRFLDYIAAGVRDSSGSVLASGTVTVYAAGTTTLQTVYSDYELTTPHTNPLTLDAYGRANVWADRRVKIVIASSAGTAVRTLDDVGGIGPEEIVGDDIADSTITPSKLDISSFASVVSGIVTSVTAATTITDDDGIGLLLVTTASSAITVTLPTASDNTNRVIRIKKVDSGSGKVTVDGEGSETIDGATTWLLPRQQSTVELFCNGVGWNVVSHHRCQVFSHFQSNAGTSISNDTTTIVDYEDTVVDTHSAVTIGASWKFTAPRDGLYTINATAQFASVEWTAGELMSLGLFKNNAQVTVLSYVRTDATNTQVKFATGGFTLLLAATDYVDVRVYQNTGAGLALSSNAVDNNISIVSAD
jgi:hypothetical protein